MSKYEIYPIPQSIKYLNGKTDISSIKVENIEILDEVNHRKIKKVFGKRIVDEALVSISISIDENLGKFDHYKILVDGEGIKIIAKSQDAIFYALQTLEEILSQTSDEISHLEIEDFASVKYRGIIEGYYGIPWSWENKKELIRFGSRFKNNIFLFAPKDDPYHRDKWRELYPEKELEEIADAARIGNEYRNRFAYTISPFKKEADPITAENLEESYKVLESKFEQLYEVGVRQFGVLGDDVGKLPYDVVVEVMNRLSNWSKTKGDVKDFVYCPYSYVLSWAWEPEELNAYNEGFPEDVHIFFTGRNTCTSVNRADIEEHKTREITEEFGGKGNVRRDPFFWLNWPVNDIDANYRKLYIGKGEILDKDVDNIVGLVTNPMQEAMASKVAIFAVSDYAWNIKGFDVDKSWSDSFKYIDKHASKELQEIAKHMSNQDEKGIAGLEESEELKELQERLLSSFETKLVSEVKTVVVEIKEKFEEIIKSIDIYFNKSRYEELKNEIRPFANSLKELLLSGIYYIDAFGALEEGQKEIGLKLYDKAEYYFEKYAYHPVNSEPKSNINMMKTEAGMYRIKPMITILREYLDKPFAKKRSISKKVKVFERGFDNSTNYRIPSLLRTEEGTLLAFADKRNEHRFDWGNIDLAVRRKEKGQTEFGENNVIIDLIDQESNKLSPYEIWPIDKKDGAVSAFVIDPVTVQSNSGKIFALVTSFPESFGFFSIKETGNGYIKIDGKSYLELLDKEGNRYYLDGENVYTLEGEKTKFTVKCIDEAPYRTTGDLFENGEKIGNILLMSSKLFVKQTSHIFLTTSDDDGKTWSKPVDLNPSVKEEWMKFMGVAPGRGVITKTGRIIIPAYFTNEFDKQSACLIYSDDEGQTWKRSKSVNDGRKVGEETISDREDFNYFYQTGESQPIVLDNGDILLLVRNFFHGQGKHIQIATSKDNGESFESVLEDVEFTSQAWCQLGVLHTHKDGEEYVLISSPSSAESKERQNGRVYVNKVVDSKLKYINSKPINFGMFWYSSIEEIEDKFAVLYEGGDSLKHAEMDIELREFSWEYLDSKDEILRYEIYPVPQKIEYKFRSTKLDKAFSISGELESSSKERLIEILKSNGFEIGENGITINFELDDSLTKFDEHIINIDEENILIKGANQNALYYSIMTLEQMLEQDSAFIRNVNIHDFASQKIRGTIEGYYGIPYTTQTRYDVMKFTSRFKGNAFVYAPKDDPYHREKWYELYPEKELEEFRQLGELGEKIKTRFIWTISPFKKQSNPINEESYDVNIELLIKKLDQVYDIGLRQFGVLGDDVGALPKQVVVKVMNRVSEWAKSKPEKVYDFVFVPEGYVLADWGFRPDELDLYSKEFPEDVQIMFTGDTTCAPITRQSIIDFKNREAKSGVRRDPLFWLNWPVNDVDRTSFRRLFMGKGEVLHSDVENLVGTLTNPLEEGYASLVALFAICDYSWNTPMFNADKSWKDSFKYIDKDASSELFEISKHMSNTDASGTNPNDGGIPGLEESEELKPLFEILEKSIESESHHDFRFVVLKLIEKYKNIADSVNSYLEKSKFEEMKSQLNPYILNLRDKSLAGMELMTSLFEYKYNRLENAKKHYEDATKYLSESEQHTVFTMTSEFPAKTLKAVGGTYRIDKSLKLALEYLNKRV